MRLATVFFIGGSLLALCWCLGTVLAAPGGDRNETKPWHLPTSGMLATIPEVEPNDDCATAQHWSCEDEINPASIDPEVDVDYYGFATTSGLLISCGTDYQSPGSPATDTYIELLADDCTTILAGDDDSGPGLFSLITDFQAPYTGTYYLRVNVAYATPAGPYRALLDCRISELPPSNDTCDGAIFLPGCSSHPLSGTTAFAHNDYDPSVPGPSCTGHAADGRDVVYRLDLMSGDTLSVTYTQTTADGSIYLITDCGDPASSCLAGADATGSGEPETLLYVADTSQSHYLILDSYGNATGGPWTLDYSVICPPPPPTGACCFPNGGCYVTSEAECLASGWIYQGNDTSCDPNPCPQPPTGACCFPNGGCYVTSEAECLASGWIYQGNDTSCDPNPCPQPPGACCFAAGHCTVLTPPECASAGGAWQGVETSCNPNPCPQPGGACCFHDGHCSFRTEAECESLAGAWQGPGTGCYPNPCPQPTGACCLTSLCLVLTQAECVAQGGSYQGHDTICSPDPCAAPAGACCFYDGHCTVQTSAACAFAGGGWQGPATSCTPNPCPQSTGACCLSDRSCVVMTHDACVAQGGRYRGDDSDCSPNPCCALSRTSTSSGQSPVSDSIATIPDPRKHPDDPPIGGPVPAVNCDASGSTCYESCAFYSIPDCSGPVNMPIVVGARAAIWNVVVSVDMSHTWIGDMNLKLVHQDTGTSVTLLCRPGLFDPSCPTSGCCGCSDDIDGVYSFDDGSAGAMLGNPFSGCFGGFASPGCYKPVSALVAFDGESAAGTWNLVGQDGACGDLFFVYAWAICFSGGGGTATEHTTWSRVKAMYR